MASQGEFVSHLHIVRFCLVLSAIVLISCERGIAALKCRQAIGAFGLPIRLQMAVPSVLPRGNIFWLSKGRAWAGATAPNRVNGRRLLGDIRPSLARQLRDAGRRDKDKAQDERPDAPQELPNRRQCCAPAPQT